MGDETALKKKKVVVLVQAGIHGSKVHEHELFIFKYNLERATEPPDIETVDDIDALKERLEKKDKAVDIIFFFTERMLEMAKEVHERFKVKTHLFAAVDVWDLTPGGIFLIQKPYKGEEIRDKLLE